mgnify:CR=1 FL=1|jgi:hypothetical protein
MSSIFNFNDDDGDGDDAKINIDELYEKKHQDDLTRLNTYKKILSKIHNKIKYVSRQNKTNQHYWYVVPEVILGLPHYNNSDCIAYVMNELNENGFSVNYTHPNLLLISWAHWVPSYVRNEIKKKTGIQVNQFGTITNKPNEESQSSPFAKASTSINNKSNNPDTSKSIYDTDILNKFNFKFNK